MLDRCLPCARCGHTKLVHARPREFSVDTSYSSIVSDFLLALPMFAAHRVSWRNNGDPAKGFGELAAVICRSCGFVDWYCKDPASIPIGDEYNTREIEAEPDPRSPYR